MTQNMDDQLNLIQDHVPINIFQSKITLKNETRINLNDEESKMKTDPRKNC